MPKAIIIVGGGSAGIATATRLRRLDESAMITVFEKGAHVSYASCGIPYALGDVIRDDALLLPYDPHYFKQRFNIDVYVNTEVVEIDRRNEQICVRSGGNVESHRVDYDKLVLCLGAEPIWPSIDHQAHCHVFHLRTSSHLQEIKTFMVNCGVGNVCIIGGGLLGIEAAENLRKISLKVSIVEQTSHIIPGIDRGVAEILHAELERNGVKLYLDATVKGISKSYVVLSNGAEVPAEFVLLAAGMEPRKALAEQAGLEVGFNGVRVEANLQTSDEDIYAIGDMAETRHRFTKHPVPVAFAGPASRQGRMVANDIAGRTTFYRGNVGTVVCQVFRLSVGFTGLSVPALRELGQEPLWVTVHPTDHASYYPNAHPMTIKLAFEKKSGRILGVQAVGGAGVDKRIDVLATAMQADMTVLDLEHLELGFAPPYGSAKDPVNIVGFVATNVLRGDCRIVHVEDLDLEGLDYWQVVDVRSPEEFASSHILPAINVPIDALREKMSLLDKTKPIVVYCDVGYRGYLAYRILSQKGFDVFNLDGGMKTVVEAGFKNLVK
ncbi:hypothetical protein LMH87_002886 [Akanthomyces muscarius]|uniref:Rhodanese domain-containing protein n=1 Tax=Akanthomyces muscarius TaxID=2231603 RepID=A0A9W8Q996_AKAMU|nr:hypothetical protein LMH87_002886 [Akanthomyces muscarius]KAJ4148415.1 hypothetical protein LMH87_002886 [Akanthomyces muscarius]